MHLPQADLQAAELAKRSLAAEREELSAVREELRRQQAAAAAEAGRLAELQQVGLGWRACGFDSCHSMQFSVAVKSLPNSICLPPLTFHRRSARQH